MSEEKQEEKIDIEAKVKSGEWTPFEIHFTAQMDGYAVSHAVVVVAAPDYTAALMQFGRIINIDKKQVVALVNKDGSRDMAFLNVGKADFVAVIPQDDKKANVVEMPEGKSCENCGKERCECQTDEKPKKD